MKDKIVGNLHAINFRQKGHIFYYVKPAIGRVPIAGDYFQNFTADLLFFVRVSAVDNNIFLCSSAIGTGYDNTNRLRMTIQDDVDSCIGIGISVDVRTGSQPTEGIRTWTTTATAGCRF